MPIKFNDVFFTYQPKTPNEYLALKDVSLTIKDKSFTCIVGHTGCGKSTLIQHLNGLLLPTSGSVQVNEYELSKKNRRSLRKLHHLRKEVGVVFQFSEYQLFDETVESDVAFGPSNFGVKPQKSLQIAHKCLKTVGISSSYFKKSPFELSGGEKRRVALAGILALEPKILVLDEPTAGLDPQGQKEILDLFKKLNKKGVTIILVTHDINLVYEYATDVIVMNDGRVELVTTPAKLFKEDVSKYSLETPLIQKTVDICLKKGLNLKTAKIHNIEDLAAEIARAKNE